jgi:hypothetical protein
MEFSQFNLELDVLQVGLGWLMHLQVKQSKRRAIKTQMGYEIDTFPQWSCQSVVPHLPPR